MYKKFLFSTALTMAVFSVNSAKAEETLKAKQKKEIITPAITVIASREVQQPAKESLYIDENPPQTPFTDSADFLQSLPGISAGRFGGHGLELVVRGQSQNRLNILDDGAFNHGGCPNRMDPPTAYSSVESKDVITVIRGYQTVLNGAGGSGGTILFEKEKPILEDEVTFSGDVTAGYDGNSELKYSNGYVLGGNDKAYAKANLSFKDGGNYEDGSGHGVSAEFKETTSSLTLGLTPNDTHAYITYDFNRIDDALFPGAGMDSPISMSNGIKLGLTSEERSETLKKMDIKAYASFVDHEMDNYTLRTKTAAPYRLVKSESNTFGASVKTDLDVKGQDLKTTIDLKRNNRDADRLQGTTPINVATLQSIMWPDITIDEVGFGAETTFHPAEATRIVAGGRYDFVHVNYGRPDLSSAVTGRSANDLYRQFYGVSASNTSENNVSGLLRLEHDKNSELTLFTSLNRSIRTADATERGLANDMVMGVTNMSWVGNPDIKPEEHNQFELGFDYHKSGLNIAASTYVNYVSNYILRDSARAQRSILVSAPMATIYRNVDAILSGVELHGEYQATKDISLSANLTYTYGQNEDDNKALAQIPPLQGSISADWNANDDLTITATSKFASMQTRVDTNRTIGSGLDVGQTGGYAVFDLHATLHNFEPFELTFGIDNIFDKKYANHLNRSNVFDPTQVQVNEPGRSFFIQGKYRF